MANFSAQVGQWARNSKDALEAVFHDSAQAVVDEMQKVGPSVASTKAAIAKGARLGKGGRNSKRAVGPVSAAGAGGNMPVDTGFLRASLLASSDSMPQMSDDAQPKEGGSYSYSSGPISLVINETPLGGKIYCGYTAAYAARINYGFTGNDALGRHYSQAGRMFVELAAQKWPQFVKQAEERAAQAFK